MSAPAKTEQNRIFTIPNLLSMARLCLIPVMVWCYSFRGNTLWTALLLALSGLTDVADGFIARRFHMVSELGKAIDPVADKLTQLVMLLCLLDRYPYMLLPLAVLLLKEVLDGITGLLVIRATGKVLGAVWHGKTATVLLYVVMGLHLLWGNMPRVVSCALVGAATAMSLVSGVLYTLRNLSLLGKGKTVGTA